MSKTVANKLLTPSPPPPPPQRRVCPLIFNHLAVSLTSPDMGIPMMNLTNFGMYVSHKCSNKHLLLSFRE
jgi:hypothetical protein